MRPYSIHIPTRGIEQDSTPRLKNYGSGNCSTMTVTKPEFVTNAVRTSLEKAAGYVKKS